MQRTANDGSAAISLLKNGTGSERFLQISEKSTGRVPPVPDFSPPRIHAAAPGFDYDSLAHDVRALVGAQTAAILELNGDSLAGKVEIGRRLLAIRKAVGPHDFQPLVSHLFGWTKGTTSNYKSVARVFGRLRPWRLARFDWSALVILSRKGVRRAARAEALTRARAGQNINKALAEAIVARHLKLPERDPDDERLVNRLCQVLHKVELRNDRLAATLHRRVSQRLAKSVLLFAHCSPETETSETEDVQEETVSSPVDVRTTSSERRGVLRSGIRENSDSPPGLTGILTNSATESCLVNENMSWAPAGEPHELGDRSLSSPLSNTNQRRAAIVQCLSVESSTRTAPSRSRLDFQPSALPVRVSIDPASVGPRLAATSEPPPTLPVRVSTDPVSVGPRLAAIGAAAGSSSPDLWCRRPACPPACPTGPSAGETPAPQRTRSRRKFLAGFGLTLAALCGRHSSASAEQSALSAASGDTPTPFGRDPVLRSISTTYIPGGPTVTTYTYTYDAFQRLKSVRVNGEALSEPSTDGKTPGWVAGAGPFGKPR